MNILRHLHGGRIEATNYRFINSYKLKQIIVHYHKDQTYLNKHFPFGHSVISDVWLT